MEVSTPDALKPPGPQDAANNIEGAMVFNLNPDKYAEFKDQLQPTVDKMKSPPADLSPVVKSYAAQSLQHQGLINGNGPKIAEATASVDPMMTASDPVKHNATESWMDFLGGQIKHGWQGNQDVTNATMDKILHPDQWNENKELDLQSSRELDKMNTPSEDGVNGYLATTGHVLGNFAGMASDMWNNKGVFASSIGTGIAIGGAKAKAPGAVAGGLLGLDAGFAYSTFKNTAASVYNDLSDQGHSGAPDVVGGRQAAPWEKPIDETTKRNTALGVGFVNATIQFGAGRLLMSSMPGVNQMITKNAVKAMMTEPAQAATKAAIMNLGKSVATMGAAGSSQAAIQTFATAFAENYKGNGGNFLNALMNSTSDLKDAMPQILKTGAETALTTGVVHAGLGAASKLGGQPAASMETGKLPIGNQETAASVVQSGVALDQIHKISMSTKLGEIAPVERTQLLKGMADKAGVKEVYIDPKDVQETWGEKGGSGAAVRSWFSGKGMNNEPVPVPIHQFFDLAKDDPKIIDKARMTPDGMSVEEAKGVLAKPDEETSKQTSIEPSEKLLDPEEEIRKANAPAIAAENPNLELADKFKGQPGEKGLVSHVKNGFSQLAIEPNTLDENQKSLLKDPQLKEHGVFVKGGIDASDAATMLGFKDSDTMFKTLQTTPTRSQALEVSKPPESSVPITPKELTANTKAHLEEMQGLKKLTVLPAKGEKPISIREEIPTYGQVTADAKAQVGETKIGELNPDIHKVGERNSVQLAKEALDDGRNLDSFNARLAAARSSELAKRSQDAVTRVNKVVQLVAKFTPDAMEQLKAKGKEYFDAANEVLSKIGLSQETDVAAKDGSLEKTQDKLTNDGGIVGILSDPKSLPNSFDNLTVNQALAVGDTLRTIIKNADMKDQFYTKPEVDVADSSLNGIANEVERLAKEHPLYDPSKSEPEIKSNEDKWKKFNRYFSDETSFIRQMQSFYAQMDMGKPAGFFYKLLFDPMDKARNTEEQYRTAVADQTKKMITAFGEKDYFNLANDKVFVPEFAGKKGLGDSKGNISREALIALRLNTGNEYNLSAVDRFGIDRTTMLDVLNRELGERHENLAKDTWNIYKSFYDKAQALQMRTEGTEFEPVQGDYYPMHYLNDDVDRMGKQLLGSYDLNKLKQNMTAQALTEQGHTIAREGSQQLLDLDLNRHAFSVNQLIHDLSYREAVADTAKLLAHPKISDAIAGIAGKGALELAKNNLIDAAGKVDREGYNKSGKLLENITSKVTAGTRVVNVGLKLSSALKAFSALPQLRATMSANEGGILSAERHIVSTAVKLLSRPDFMFTGRAMEFAREIDPTIKNMGDDMMGKTVNHLSELMPETGNKILDPLTWATNLTGRLSLLTVSSSHQMVKALGALAAHSQAFSGDVKGIEAGDHEAAMTYAKGVSATTMSHYEPEYQSVLQKKPFLKDALAYYFTDANNANNNNILQLQMARARFKESGSAYDKGQLAIATRAAAQGIGGLANHFTTVVAARALLLALTGTASTSLMYTLFGGKEPKDNEDNLAQELLKKSMIEAGGTYPLIREGLAAAAYQSGRGGYEFKNPMTQAMGNMYTAGIASLNFGLQHWTDKEDFTPAESQAILTSIGYVTKLPTDAIYKMLGSPDLTDLGNLPNTVESQFSKLAGTIGSVLTKSDAKPKDEQFDEEFLRQLDALKVEVQPAPPPAPAPAPQPNTASVTPVDKAGVPTDYYDKIKEAESASGVKLYQPGGKRNNHEGATGIYQFEKKTWNDIREQAPELGLSKASDDRKDGRLNNWQQEKAIKYLTEQNAKILEKGDVKVDEHSLYSAHVVGPGITKKLVSAKNSDKLSDYVTDTAMDENNFKPTMTVGSYKKWIASQLDKADDKLGNEDIAYTARKAMDQLKSSR